jgi:hypothetical protein
VDHELGPTLAELAGIEMAPEAPFAPHRVTPGCLDRRILDQAEVWVDGLGTTHRLDQMPEVYRANVVAHLHLHAVWMWSASAFDELLTSPVGLHVAKRVAGIRLIGETDPHLWLESTPLVRELRRLTPGVAAAEVLTGWAEQVHAQSARAGTDIWKVQGSVVPMPQDPGRNWAEDMRRYPAYEEPDGQSAGSGAGEGVHD